MIRVITSRLKSFYQLELASLIISFSVLISKVVRVSFRALCLCGMESSQVAGGDAKNWGGSSESGWTMYIGSPIMRSESNEVYYNISDHKKGGGKINGRNCIVDRHYDGESDDSMVSDASSGPSHREEVLLRRGIGGRNRSGGWRLRHADRDKKVTCRKEKKREDERLRVREKGEEEEEELLHKADSAESQV